MPNKVENNETEVESSDSTLDIKKSEISGVRSTRSKSKKICSPETKNSHLANSQHHNDPLPSCDSSVTQDEVPSLAKNSIDEEEISSTVFSDNCIKEVNESDVVSSSDDVLHNLHDGEKPCPESGNEVSHVDSSNKIDINVLKSKLRNKTSNIALNGASRKCNENENEMSSSLKCIRMKTDEFSDDIVQTVDELCEKVEVNSSIDSETVIKAQKRKLDDEDMQEDYVTSGVSSSVELKNQEETAYECEQKDKIDDIKDDDEEEEEGFNEDILCIHGK